MSADEKMGEEAVARLTRHVNELGEHFDTVQIFVTRHEPGVCDGTLEVNHGCGNFYARESQIRAWVIRQEEQVRIKARRDQEGGD